ncbi:MAG: hypothetical protein R2827_04030 [Bdellovibrionales bacterium]
MKLIYLFCLVFLMFGCGVKGDPRPPLKPTDIGRGRPGFKGALNVQDMQTNQNENNEESDDEEEDEREKKQ